MKNLIDDNDVTIELIKRLIRLNKWFTYCWTHCVHSFFFLLIYMLMLYLKVFIFIDLKDLTNAKENSFEKCDKGWRKVVLAWFDKCHREIVLDKCDRSRTKMFPTRYDYAKKMISEDTWSMHGPHGLRSIFISRCVS